MGNGREILKWVLNSRCRCKVRKIEEVDLRLLYISRCAEWSS